MRTRRLQALLTLGTLAPLMLVGAAHASPAYYVQAGLDNALTCTYAVKWDAPKASPPSPPELSVASVQTPIVWPRAANSTALFQGERFGGSGYNPLFARNALVANPNTSKESGRISFAFNGRPLIRDEDLNLRVLLDDATWQSVLLKQAATTSLQLQGYSWNGQLETGVSHETRVVFDEQCHAYTVVNAFRSPLDFPFLLHSRDGGSSWAAYPLPGWAVDGQVRMEVPTSSRGRLAAPPVIVLHSLDGGPEHRAVLLFPEKNLDGTLKRSANGFLQVVDVNPATPQPDFVTVNDTVCCMSHAGHETQVVAFGDKVHFAYPGDTTHAVTANGVTRYGTPQYVVTFLRSTGAQQGTRFHVGTGLSGPASAPADVCQIEPPNPDPCPQSSRPNLHNQPALAVGTDGFLHVMIGGHAGEMWYRRSTSANSSASWSTAVSIGLPVSAQNPVADEYTYPSLVLDSQNRPHVLARWSGEGGLYEFNVVHVYRTSPNGPWSAQKILLKPDRNFYTNWYHKLAVDRLGRLFVSYWYYPANLFADEAQTFATQWGFTLTQTDAACLPMNRMQPGAGYCEYTGYKEVSPGLLISTDSGATFRLATTTELFSGTPPSPPPPARPALDAAVRAIVRGL
jgi:hypothetical protein